MMLSWLSTLFGKSQRDRQSIEEHITSIVDTHIPASLDSRKGIAQWAVRTCNEIRARKPALSSPQVMQLALDGRYQNLSLTRQQAEVLRLERESANTEYDLCHTVAEVELLNHLTPEERLALKIDGVNIVDHTYRTIDRELEKLGIKRGYIHSIAWKKRPGAELFEREFAKMLSSHTGAPLAEARVVIQQFVREAEVEARQDGSDRLPFNYGDVLLLQEETDERIRQDLKTLRQEGVFDADIRNWWNEHEVYRRVLERLDGLRIKKAWDEASKLCRTEQETYLRVRKFHPIYGEPIDNEFARGDDRPLPMELFRRITEWALRQKPEVLQLLIEKASSMNALIRAEIRAGRL